MNSIEKFNYFTNKMDFFSIDRVFNLVGISAGFAFSVDDMIRGNVKQSLNTQAELQTLSETLVNLLNSTNIEDKENVLNEICGKTNASTLCFDWNKLMKTNKKLLE